MEIEMRVTSQYIYIYVGTEILEFKQYEDDITLEDKLCKLITLLGHKVIKK